MMLYNSLNWMYSLGEFWMSFRYLKASLSSIEPSACPCGLSRRAFMDAEVKPVTVHLLEVSRETEPHYHKKMTECYTILEGEGYLELDGEMVPVRPMDTVMIRPGCVHRPIGQLKILNVAIPGFDPADEYIV